MESFKNSFKISPRDPRHSPRGSADSSDHNYQPILSDQPRDDTNASSSHREVIVKIMAGDAARCSDADQRGDGPTITRELSWKDWKTKSDVSDDGFNFHQPPKDSKEDQSSGHLNKQKNSGEVVVDMDVEMQDFHHLYSGRMPQIPRRSNDESRHSANTEVAVPTVHDETRTVSSSENERSPGVEDYNSGGDILRGASPFQRWQSNRWMTKTQSRLSDPPDPLDMRTEVMARLDPSKSGLISGMLKNEEEEELDPLFDEDLPDDLPDDFKQAKLDALAVIQWIGLISIITSLVCTLSVPKWKKRTFRGLQYWKWEVLVLVLICGQLVSGWGIKIVVFFVERNFLLRKRLLYFVYGIRNAVQNCIWLGLVLLAWRLMFDNKVEANNKFLIFTNKLLVCMLVAMLLWLLKTLMVKVLASSFHVSTYFDRIQESLFNQYVIVTLSGPPLIEIQNNIPEEDESCRPLMSELLRLEKAGVKLSNELTSVAHQGGKSKGVFGNFLGTPSKPSPKRSTTMLSGGLAKQKDGITIDHLHRLNPKNVSAWNMKRLMNIVRNGTLLTLDERILGTSHDDESNTQIRSEREAKLAARKIFRNVARPGMKYINLDDLMRFLREEEAFKTMSLFEASPDGKISKSALKNWVVNAFRERRALALTLNDTKTAVNKLHKVVNVVVGILILIIWLIILEIATSRVLLFASSQIVLVAFIFGNTCKTIFEAIIFLFVMHPFDVGDRCEIEGIQMIVEEMNILNTVFLRYDNLKIIFPNSTLATKAISNYYRSPDMGDSIDFNVHIATPAEKIAILKQRVESYVDNKKDHWYSSPMVVLMDLVDLNAIKMSVWLRHKMNHQDMGERWTRRALLAQEMVDIFKELGIEHRLYPIDISIRDMPSVNFTRIPPSWNDSSTQ